MSQPETPYNTDEARSAQIRELLGPVAPYLKQPDVSDVMANADGTVWIARHGKPQERLDIPVFSVASRRAIIDLVASASEQLVSTEQPKVSGIVPGTRARFEGVVPPGTTAPHFAIRLPSTKQVKLDDYVAKGLMSAEQVEHIRQALHAHENILVVGRTGSGKTTLLRAILAELATTTERVLTIEDTPELEQFAPNTVPLHIEEGVSLSYAGALESALRLRPDRIVVGELRSPEAATGLIAAWSTGHGGGLTTLHAGSAKQAMDRLVELIGQRSRRIPWGQISRAIGMIIVIDISPAGERKVREIVRVRPSTTTGAVGEDAWMFEPIGSKPSSPRRDIKTALEGAGILTVLGDSRAWLAMAIVAQAVIGAIW